MTGNKCLLDTSVIIHAFKKHNIVSEKLDTMHEVCIPVTAIGELFYGAYKSANPAKHIIQYNLFCITVRFYYQMIRLLIFMAVLKLP